MHLFEGPQRQVQGLNHKQRGDLTTSMGIRRGRRRGEERKRKRELESKRKKDREKEAEIYLYV